MDFRTIVNIDKPTWQMEHASRVLLLGSCFADNIGERLQRAGIRAEVNPFGTLYNPASVANALERIMDNRPFTSDEIVPFGAEGWGSWDAHSLLSKPTQAEALHVLNKRLETAADTLRQADVLIITLGTVWTYRLKENNAFIVANCHHEAAEKFVRERMSIEDITAIWSPLMQQLSAAYPNLHILFTVSPIRHLKDGAHGNQLSKATLLLAADSLITTHPQAAYFPAYEIVLDELRDYRFYAEDMVHPSAQAVEYLWERFTDTFLSVQAKQLAARVEELRKALAHRPLHPESEEYKRFREQTQRKADALQNELPYVQW